MIPKGAPKSANTATLTRRPLKTHRKSRGGCKTCKARKVKCDEHRPLCMNCARRSLDIDSCDFEPLEECNKSTPRPRSHVSPAPSETSSATTVEIEFSVQRSITPRPKYVSGSPFTRMLEMRLMHHYTTHARHGMRHVRELPGRFRFWDFDAPKLAFQDEAALDAILALSALHLRKDAPNDSDVFFAAGHYFAKAVNRLRASMNKIDSTNAEIVLATSMMTAHFTWLASQSARPGEPYTLPIQFFFLLRGKEVVAGICEPFVKGIRQRWDTGWPSMPDVVPPSFETAFVRSGRDDIERLLQAIDDKVPDEDRKIYFEAAEYMLSIYTALVSGISHIHLHRSIDMPTHVQILPLLSRHDPLAMAFLVRNACVVQFVDYVWWIHGAKTPHAHSEYHVRGIGGLMPEEWQWTMEWPRRVISGEITLEGEIVTRFEEVVLEGEDQVDPMLYPKESKC